jgi:hypothetical protein
MQIPCDSRAHCVAAGQQRRRPTPLVRASVLVLASSSVASSAEPSPTPSRPAASRADGSYAGTLGASYLVAPLLALAVGGGLSELEASDELAVLAGGTMFLAPMGVHLYHQRADRAGLALGSMFGITLGAAVSGGVLGYVENVIACDPDRESECADRGIGTIIVGAVIGSGVGYVTSAVLDVAFRSSAPEAAPNAPPAAQFWLVPSRAAASPVSADGLLVGVTWRL